MKRSTAKKRQQVRRAPLTTTTFSQLSDAEKAAIYRACEREPAAPAGPLTAAQRAAWAKFQRRAGRPKIGQGAKRVLVSVEKGLLAKADAYAKANDVNRSELIARGLRAVLRGAA
jgi:hypothetical protein